MKQVNDSINKFFEASLINLKEALLLQVFQTNFINEIERASNEDKEYLIRLAIKIIEDLKNNKI